jgi:2,4-dienoyl-CoA reductase (NADPH2)
VAAAVLQQKKATFIGLGRSSFAYPNAPRDLMQYGKMRKEKTCTSCSICTEMMRNMLVTGCPIRDKEVYGPIYKNIKR